jgi:hypothetical protein
MPGVYELADERKTLLYIGQSEKDAPNRIRQHLVRHACLRARAVYWRYAFSRVPQAEEELQLRRYLSRNGALPPCNKSISRERGAERRYRERSRHN